MPAKARGRPVGTRSPELGLITHLGGRDAAAGAIISCLPGSQQKIGMGVSQVLNTGIPVNDADTPSDIFMACQIPTWQIP